MPYMQPPLTKSCKPPNQYQPPCEPLDACTVYRSSFCPPVCVRRPPPLRMPDNLGPTDCSMEDACTVYRCSFCPPVCVCRPPPSRVQDNLGPVNCKMEDQTIHKLSYPCHPCTKPPCPCDRSGEDPCYSNPIVHPCFLKNSSGISEGCSVMQMSYKPPCPQERQRSYKPMEVYERPNKPFQGDTVARMSYVPWPVKRKEDYPWACKKSCLFARTPMECTSVYQSSYFAPGQYS